MQGFKGYRRPENIVLRIYEVLAYDFKRSDSEIFAMPTTRVNALISEWSRDMKERNYVKKKI